MNKETESGGEVPYFDRPENQKQKMEEETETEEETGIKVLKVLKYKVGYEVRTIILPNGFTMRAAYTPKGHYIGNPRTARRLVVKRGIAPELAEPGDKTCTIGYCSRRRMWYGWSHRAIHGFKPGSKCRMGDVGYMPDSPAAFIESLKRWYSGNGHHNLHLIPRKTGVTVAYDFVNKKGEIIHYHSFEKYPKTWGRGEWMARNNQDARQMGIDFAEGCG